LKSERADVPAIAQSKIELRKLIGASIEIEHVLICMVFQLGYRGTAGFKKMLFALRRCNYRIAGAEMLNSKWAKRDTPARATRLSIVVRGLVSDEGE